MSDFLPTCRPVSGGPSQQAALEAEGLLQPQSLCTPAGGSAQGYVAPPHGRSVADLGAPSRPCTVGPLPQTTWQRFPSLSIHPARAVDGLPAHFTFPSGSHHSLSKKPRARMFEGALESTHARLLPLQVPSRGCQWLSQLPEHQPGPAHPRALRNGGGTCASKTLLVICYFI